MLNTCLMMIYHKLSQQELLEVYRPLDYIDDRPLNVKEVHL